MTRRFRTGLLGGAVATTLALAGCAQQGLTDAPGLSPLANMHFLKPVVFDFNEATGATTASGSVVGLGHEDVTVTLEAKVTAELVCRKPNGNPLPPGLQKTLTSTKVIPNLHPENGRVNFDITATAPDFSRSCPNGTKFVEAKNYQLEHATLSVTQAGETISQSYP